MSHPRLGAADACFPPPPPVCISQGSASLSLSSLGTFFIKSWEQFKPQLYNDAGGHCTIGYGHLVHKNHCDSRSSETAFQKGITEEQGASLFNTRLPDYVGIVRDYVDVELTQYEFDALVSFAFNAGREGFRTSTLLRFVNAGKWNLLRAEFMKWVNSGGKVSRGLIRRRNAEANMFLNAYYQLTH